MSTKEAKRYTELKLLEKGGFISGLKLQQRFPFVVNGMLICTYVADFVYHDGKNIVVEDAKGYRTERYLLNRKLMRALYGITIFES